MPTVAMVDGIKIEFYHEDHPPPHFHAIIAEFDAQIDIETLEVVRGILGNRSIERSSNGLRHEGCN